MLTKSEAISNSSKSKTKSSLNWTKIRSISNSPALSNLIKKILFSRFEEEKNQDEEEEDLEKTLSVFADKLEYIRNDEQLYFYYKSFINTLAGAYHEAIVIDKGNIKLDKEKGVVTLGAKLLGLIPMVGSNLKELIDLGHDFYQAYAEHSYKRKAQNITTLCAVTELNEIVETVCVEF